MITNVDFYINELSTSKVNYGPWQFVLKFLDIPIRGCTFLL